jgi:hypothetical protein
MDHQGEYLRFADDSSCGAFPDEDFEGLWIEHWPNGQLKFRGYFKKRHKRVGQHICFWPNGVLREVSFWDEGWVCGTVIWFREDGSKESEKDYGEFGSRTRSWTERWYGGESELWKVIVWRDGRPIAEWEDPQTRRIGNEVELDRIVNDAVKGVYPGD